MRSILKILMWCVFALIGWSIFSCEEFCEESNRTAMVVNFYSDSAQNVLTMEKISVETIGSDTILYRNTRTSVVMCPLNPAVDVSAFVFVNDTISDTITVAYTRHPGFVSSECGCVNYADITNIQTTTNSIKKVEITSPNVTPVTYRPNVVNAENIRVYY